MNPTLAGIISLAFFSTGGLLVAMAAPMPGLQLASMALLSGAGFLAFYLKMYGHNLAVGFRQPFKSYIFAVLGIGLYTALFYSAMSHAPAFEINMLNYLWPILLALFSAALKTHTLAPHHIAGVVLGFTGTVFIFQPAEGSMLFENFGVGHALIIAGAIVWSAYSACIKGKQYPAAMLVPVMFVSGLLCGALHFMLEETRMDISQLAWVAILLLGMTRVSFALWDYGMKYGDTLALSSLSYFVPLLSAALFIIFGYKPASPEVGIGGALIVLGCLIVNASQIIAYARMKLQKRMA
jgi:drug/metabolite transporter (DMT)-like permease